MRQKGLCYIFFLAVSVILSGCAVTYEQYEMVEDPAPVLQRFVSGYQLRKGLSPAEVKSLLGEQIVIGYEMPDSQSERYKPLTVQNPYRKESYETGQKTYQIQYYVAGINQDDDKITDDELMPLVFYENRLIGWGWDFFNRSIKK